MVLEHLLGTAILRFAHQYIADLDLSALRLSIFRGSIVLRDIQLKLDVFRHANLPIEFQRAFIRELRIRIPWLRLHSEPIEVHLEMLELVATLSETGAPSTPRDDAELPTSIAAEGAPPRSGGTDGSAGWVRSLLSKAVMNATLRVTNAVVKFVQGRAVASLSLRRMEVLSAGAQWQRGAPAGS